MMLRNKIIDYAPEIVSRIQKYDNSKNNKRVGKWKDKK